MTTELKTHDIKGEYTPTSVLLTGGAGFIGSNVLLHFMQAWPTCTFVCLDKLSYCASLKNLAEVAQQPRFTFVQGDICSVDLVKHLMKTYHIDTVLHFAAETHVDNSFGNSFSFTTSNVMGTHVLLECTKTFKSQIQRFIHVSTDEVYGESTLEETDEAFQEHDVLNPSNPYAATKAAAEFLVKAYTTSFDLPCIITRGNNVYGPRQYPEKLIPKFITLLEQGSPVPIHGDGHHKRSYLYVGDVAKAFETVVKKGTVGAIYNIGTSFELSNLETATALLKALGLEDHEDTYLTFVPDRYFNDVRYHIGSDKLQELGWVPETSFVEVLHHTIQWYRNHKDHWGDISQALVAHPRQGVLNTDQ